ncbi:MAG: YhbY family RNA-binding protein [Candidatus Woesearchaeota archaeon]
MDKEQKTMRSDSTNITPNIIIGKNGPTDAVIANIKNELSRNKLVKVKILSTYISDKNKSEVFNEIIEKTGSKSVKIIGFTITLTKR